MLNGIILEYTPGLSRLISLTFYLYFIFNQNQKSSEMDILSHKRPQKLHFSAHPESSGKIVTRHVRDGTQICFYISSLQQRNPETDQILKDGKALVHPFCQPRPKRKKRKTNPKGRLQLIFI